MQIKIRVQVNSHASAKRVWPLNKVRAANTNLPEGAEELGEIMSDGTLKIKLKSPAEDGKANEELIQLLSKHLNVPVKKITIIRGKTSRHKLIEILPR